MPGLKGLKNTREAIDLKQEEEFKQKTPLQSRRFSPDRFVGPKPSGDDEKILLYPPLSDDTDITEGELQSRLYREILKAVKDAISAFNKSDRDKDKVIAVFIPVIQQIEAQK